MLRAKVLNMQCFHVQLQSVANLSQSKDLKASMTTSSFRSMESIKPQMLQRLLLQLKSSLARTILISRQFVKVLPMCDHRGAVKSSIAIPQLFWMQLIIHTEVWRSWRLSPQNLPSTRSSALSASWQIKMHAGSWLTMKSLWIRSSSRRTHLIAPWMLPI